MAIANLKRCCGCAQVLPKECFSADARASDGLQSRCKPCINAARRAAYLADPEQARAKRRKYYEENSVAVCAINQRSRQRNSESVKESKRRHYLRIRDDEEFLAKRRAYSESRKDEKREYDRRYREANAQRLTSVKRLWSQKNRALITAIKKAYKSRRRQLERGGDSTAAIARWEAAADKRCYWCRAKCVRGYHVDHYQPLAKGGKHEISNLVIACPKCNLRKNARDPYEFAASVGRLF